MVPPKNIQMNFDSENKNVLIIEEVNSSHCILESLNGSEQINHCHVTDLKVSLQMLNDQSSTRSQFADRTGGHCVLFPDKASVCLKLSRFPSCLRRHTQEQDTDMQTASLSTLSLEL